MAPIWPDGSLEVFPNYQMLHACSWIPYFFVISQRFASNAKNWQEAQSALIVWKKPLTWRNHRLGFQKRTRNLDRPEEKLGSITARNIVFTWIRVEFVHPNSQFVYLDFSTNLVRNRFRHKRWGTGRLWCHPVNLGSSSNLVWIWRPWSRNYASLKICLYERSCFHTCNFHCGKTFSLPSALLLFISRTWTRIITGLWQTEWRLSFCNNAHSNVTGEKYWILVKNNNKRREKLMVNQRFPQVQHEQHVRRELRSVSVAPIPQSLPISSSIYGFITWSLFSISGQSEPTAPCSSGCKSKQGSVVITRQAGGPIPPAVVASVCPITSIR